MSQMKELFLKVSQSTELQAKLQGIMKDAEAAGGQVTGEQMIEFAKSAGFEISLEDMKNYFQSFSARTEGELSDKDLDLVAGGELNNIGLTLSIMTLGFACALSSTLYAISGMNCGDYFTE